MTAADEWAAERAHGDAVEVVRRAFSGSVVHALAVSRPSGPTGVLRTRLEIEGDGTRPGSFGVLATSRHVDGAPSWFDSSSIGPTSVEHFAGGYAVLPVDGCATNADVEVLLGLLTDLEHADEVSAVVEATHPLLAEALVSPESADAPSVRETTLLVRALAAGAPLEWVLRRVGDES